jgi:serine/threonine protein kinase
VLASLNHPNIAAIHGLEQTGNSHALVLELVEGEDLSERLKRGPLPVEEALDVCKQIAEALEAAHEKGIIHRDLKPGNVKLTAEGKVKVLDFGLAKTATTESTSISPDSPTITADHTLPGTLLGTAGYMSPEQARGKAVDKRSDALAVSGDRAKAGQILRDLENLAKQRYVSSAASMVVYLGLGEKDMALEWLEKSYADRDPQCWPLKVEPFYDSLRTEPRFQALLKKVFPDP